MQFTTLPLILTLLTTSALTAPAPIDTLKDLKLWNYKDFLSTLPPATVAPRSPTPQGAFSGAHGCCTADQAFKINISCGLLCGAFSGKSVGADPFVEGCVTSCTSSFFQNCGGSIC